MDHVTVDCQLFASLARDLVAKIPHGRDAYRAILCPLRGGFYLSNYVSRKLNLPLIYIGLSSYTGNVRGEILIDHAPILESGRYLLCDDIHDSGATIAKIHELYPHADFDTLCLVAKSQTAPVIWAMLVDPSVWVDFFWEIME